jgi:hypothetical protein
VVVDTWRSSFDGLVLPLGEFLLSSLPSIANGGVEVSEESRGDIGASLSKVQQA